MAVEWLGDMGDECVEEGCWDQRQQVQVESRSSDPEVRQTAPTGKWGKKW